MRVLVFEDNLLWSSRLMKSVQGLGHQVTLVQVGKSSFDGDQAIINLGSTSWDVTSLIQELRAKGIRTIGHAGHREAELLELGTQAGCDLVATNSQITFKLDQLLEHAPAEGS